MPVFPEISGGREWLIFVGIVPFLMLNLFLYFSHTSGEHISTVIFYTYPLFISLVLAGTVGESVTRALGLEVPSVKHLLISMILGIILGFVLYHIIQPAFSIIFSFLGHLTKLIISPHIIWLTSYFGMLSIRSVLFPVIFLTLVGVGEELLCVISMKCTANALSLYGFDEARSILGGVIISRGLWSLSHWYAWGAIGLATLPNYLFALYSGVVIFSWVGFIFRFRELWGDEIYREYVCYGPIAAHFVYDYLVIKGLMLL